MVKKESKQKTKPVKREKTGVAKKVVKVKKEKTPKIKKLKFTPTKLTPFVCGTCCECDDPNCGIIKKKAGAGKSKKVQTQILLDKIDKEILHDKIAKGESSESIGSTEKN